MFLLPNDNGDLRVWFEVDKITEDGEYFYLKGRTNLLKGSIISGGIQTDGVQQAKRA
ncbi:hypothetical protein [Pseudogracilibacillus sp. SO30301A]|uniref:hypothetical protein n=1 Tax=Pseudogracilibacillus sp. SO30301A TaxID=3098291 RepID=UPI00300E1E51